MTGLARRRRLASLEPRLLWIFGSPRSGSTWLVNLLAAHERVAKVDEPGIGAHLGLALGALNGLDPRDPDRYRLFDYRHASPHYFFSRQHEDAWRPALRRLLLERLAAQAGSAAVVAIKEPNGSEGADLVMSALPRSRLLLLVRDPRDVLDSELDSVQEGGWAISAVPGFEAPDRLSYLRRRAHMWRCRAEVVRRAYDAHSPALRRIVRYEDLRADPERVVAGLAEWLDLEAGPLAEAARRTAFDRLPPESRGRGRFARAARPGLWRANLTPEEQEAITAIVGRQLAELGYEAEPAAPRATSDVSG